MSLTDEPRGPNSYREPPLRHATGTVELVPTTALRAGESPRLAGENLDHVRALAASELPLPPIVVHRQTMRVIDGMHRLRAQALLARTHVEVRWFDGHPDDAFVLAVDANTAAGLPLSTADRKAAVARILTTHHTRSDRWIAGVTGLAATTVGEIRRCSTIQHGQSNRRVGRDGRSRPVDSAGGRLLAAEIMRADPGRSLREIAGAAGISPSTALDVRNRLRAGSDPLPAGRTTTRRPDADRASERDIDPVAVLGVLRNDPALRFTESGRALLRWLGAHVMDAGAANAVLGGLPPHCAGTVAALARHNAEFWGRFGDRLAGLAGDPVVPRPRAHPDAGGDVGTVGETPCPGAATRS
ncbi:StrR protein [Alloactinosynnema sp. L-07]|uniref:ParB/RepB/Spo0J family partition protein n=1 Tax=Alloactinosynnema sp. L-07 TaxID=1653480 RepID=UPI00065EF1D2|nr:ParB/RepB/Spo0J family partition protein [Alloactinosynnema sp. L-07]CRK61963.1 StrR protein [Alloactinosynnema sp. L-07]